MSKMGTEKAGSSDAHDMSGHRAVADFDYFEYRERSYLPHPFEPEVTP